MTRAAFTLIELLVVIAIIAILAGLLLAVMPVIRFNAKALETENRMNGVTQGLAAVASGGKVTQALQERFPVAATDTVSALGGVIHFGVGSNGAYTFQRPVDTANALATGIVTTYHRCWPDGRASGSPQALYSVARPAGTAATAATYASGDLPLVMAFPWGRQRLYVVSQRWYETAATVPHPIAGWLAIAWPDLRSLYSGNSMSIANRRLYESPEPHSLSNLRPYRSAQLLYAAGVLPDLTPATWSLSPAPRQPWNDAWGNPLVVAYALYQPPAFDIYDHPAPPSGFAGRSDNLPPNAYFEQADKAYGFTRATYISVAAAGPRLSTPLVNDAKADAIAIWKQVNEVCNRDAASVELWRVDPHTATTPFNAMMTPPWSGVRRAKGKTTRAGERCFLLAPVELQ